MQQATAEFQVKRPIYTVFDFLRNIEKISWSIDGVKEVVVKDETHSQWKVEVRAGFISQSVRLAVELTEVVRPNKITFTGSGTNVDIAGTLTLRPEGDATHVDFKAIINAKGPIGPLIDLVMGHTAEKLASNSVERIRQAIEGLPQPAPHR